MLNLLKKKQFQNILITHLCTNSYLALEIKLTHHSEKKIKNSFFYPANTDKSNSATIFVILIIGLIAGPAVSLYGSPTVSPVTAAL